MHRTLMSYARLVWAQSSATSGARLAMTVLTRRACSSAWSLARSVETRLRLLSVAGAPDLLQMPLPFDDSADDDESPSTELSSPGLADPDEERDGSSTCFGWREQAQAHESKLGHFVVYSAERANRRSCSPSTATRCINWLIVLRDFSPVLLHGGMTASERQEVLQAVRQRRRTPAPRHRRRQRGPQPSSPMPAGDQPRAAVDAGPPGAAHRAGGAHRTGEARSRRAPARGRHMRRGIGGGAGGTHATSRRRSWQHARHRL